MNTFEQKPLGWLFERLTHAVAGFAVVVGVLVLLGWLFDLDRLKSVFSGLVFMKANTALGFILSGISLWGTQADGQNLPLRIFSQACALAVLVLGLLTLGEYLIGIDFGIDLCLIKETTNITGDIPGRMAFSSTLSFVALGAAFWLIHKGKVGSVITIQALASVPILLGATGLISYVYGFQNMLRVKLDYTPMAIQASVVFVMLGLGVLNARPDYPFRQLMTSDSLAGSTVRRLFPVAVGFTFVTGWLISLARDAGYVGEVFSLALFTAANIVGYVALDLWNAGMLYKAGVQRDQAEKKVLTASKYFRSLLEASLDPLVTISADGRITDLNEATVKVTGVPRDLMIGSDFSGYFTEPDKARSGYQEVFSKGLVTDYPLAIRHVSGKLTEVLYNASVYCNENGEIAGVFAAARDITVTKAAEKRIRFLANHDRLTELPNRELFYDRLSQAISQAKRKAEHLVVFFLDLDGFKLVNDEHGHDAGDVVLKIVSQRLQSCVRHMDTVARIGGDEFAIILNDMGNTVDASIIAEKIIRMISEPIKFTGNDECSIGISIGIAIYPQNGSELDRLFNAADTAMYESKARGKSCFTFFNGKSIEQSEDEPWIVFDSTTMVGVREIDLQHENIINMLNILNTEVKGVEQAEVIAEQLDVVIALTRAHFKSEEQMMEKYVFPEIIGHKKAHQELLDEVIYLRKKFMEGGELVVLQSLKDWFLLHILNFDKPFANYLVKNRV